MAITFGLIVEDISLLKTGLRSNVVGLIICVIVGYITGMITFIWRHQWNPHGVWPTNEMAVRGTFKGLM